MPTQEASGVDFSILAEAQQHHFRLLELPPELLELLTSDDAPPLHLKSPAAAPGQTADQHAVLCSPNKTYSLRQVNTSNSLFVAKLCHGPRDELPRPRLALEAIAHSQFTLELLVAGNVSAASHIRAGLPVYASTGHHPSANPISKQALFTNLPASDVECEQDWADLACFELDREALIPSPSVKAMVWESAFSAATADGIDLTGALGEKDLSTLARLNGSQWPREALVALLKSMARSGGAEVLQLDEKKCAQCVGLALLRDRAERTRIARTAFLTAWADLLPEKWRGSAELGLLDGSFQSGDGGIVFHGGDRDGSNTAGSGAKAPAEARSALGAKRKWHEKFRASKKTA